MSESDAAAVREARDLLLEFCAHADDVTTHMASEYELFDAVQEKAGPMAERLGPVLARMETAVAAPAPDRDELREELRKAAAVAYKGPHDTDAELMHGASWKLDNGFEAGGSNVKAAVARVLRVVAGALSAGVGGVPAEPQPDGQPADELRRTQMKAALVECCEAGKVAYPDPCPWHGAGAVPQDREAGQ